MLLQRIKSEWSLNFVGEITELKSEGQGFFELNSLFAQRPFFAVMLFPR